VLNVKFVLTSELYVLNFDADILVHIWIFSPSLRTALMDDTIATSSDLCQNPGGSYTAVSIAKRISVPYSVCMCL